jgi:radical SAM protein with 4Fe4S-binding SPASM domain
MRATNDAFRGSEGAFAAALEGIRNCLSAGLKVGLRLTMTAYNHNEIPAIFDLIETEGIPRVCFYHLVAAGRGRAIDDHTLAPSQTRAALETIMDRASAAISAGRRLEVLTVDNHADGPYVYMRLLRESPARAAECLDLLRSNGGNRSGIAIGCVDWAGRVLPDQFWRDQILGSVRQRPFSEIWTDGESELLSKLRQRGRHLHGRCMRCRWMDVCNGNLRARAAAAGDAWGDDPGCYLTDEEIA